MMHLTRKISIALLLILGLPLMAQADEKDIRVALKKSYPNLEIGQISKTPYGGLYEIVINGDQLSYASADGKYLFVGNVIDIANKRDITAERGAKLVAVQWNSLPLEKSIKEVKGDGSRKLVVFSDADCPFCRKLAPELEKLNNVTIYTFLYPIANLHPQAVPVSKQIWCEKDQLAAWKAYMLKGERPTAKGDCDNTVDEVIALGNKLHVNGTPTLIFENGQRIPGLVPASKLDALMDAAAKDK